MDDMTAREIALKEDTKALDKPSFTASGEEVVFALMSFIIGWLYAKMLFPFTSYGSYYRAYYLLPLTALLVFAVEYLNRNVKRSAESVVILCGFLVNSLALSFHELWHHIGVFPQPYQYDGIWDDGQILLFIHIFFVWYVLARRGMLLDGETSHLLPMDMTNGFILVPMGNIFLRVRTLIFGVKDTFGNQDKEKKAFPWTSTIAVLASLCLLVPAVSLLMQADETYDRLFRNFADIFSFEIDDMFMFTLVFSIPVGAWLWGLMGGSLRFTDEKKESQRSFILSFLDSLKKVPSSVWTAVITVFSIFYLLFFAIQGKYLFSAFFGRLPDGFILSEYARRGFFELCKVTALNFFLLWMAARSANKDSKFFKTGCIAFLLENMLFALVAISKLALYIKGFGITPLRIQSSWFAAVLFAGCAFWIYSLLTEKKAFKYWIYFGAITLCIMSVF